tara:strand:+ start:2544 stop:3173 length:630 start_codon:yes stop_codon:yes gene_type:complete
MKRDTRYIIAEQAQRIIQGGTPTPDSEVRKDELVIYVDQAFGQMVKQSFYQNKAEGVSWIDGTFVYSFVQEVKEDKMLGMSYIKIPSTYVSLPLGMGIHTVSDVKSQFDTFVPTNPNFLGLSRGLAVGKLGGRRGYYIDNTKMYFINLSPSDCIDNVLVKLAGGIQSDELDPEVDIPLDMQDQLLRLTVELYTQQRLARKDELNDNSKD